MASVASAELSILDWLKERAAGAPGVPALIASSEDVHLTFAELAGAVDRLASDFLKQGIGRDTMVAVCLRDGPEALITLMALMSITAIVPVHVTAASAHIDKLIDTLGVSAFVGEHRPASVAWKTAEARNLGYISVDKDTSKFGQVRLTTHRAVQAPSYDRAELDDTSLCISTSGTSGHATVVAITQRSLDLNVATHARLNGYGPGTRGICAMPFTYLFAYVRSSLPMLRYGGALAVAPGYRFADMQRCCEVFRPTCMPATPTILQKFATDAEARNWRPERGVLTRFHATGEAVQETLRARLDAVFGASLSTNYGMTEVSPQVAERRPDDTFKPNAVGRIVSPWVVEAVDEDGATLPKGAVGRITLRGGQVNAIVGAQEKPRFDADGRFLTGDRGYVDDDGILYVVGRVDDVINRGGEKLDPKQIEHAFESDPDVDRAIIFGLPDPAFGQKICGLLVLRKGAIRSLDDIRDAVGSRITGWAMPEKIFDVPDIPTNANGKISRSDLIARYLNE